MLTWQSMPARLMPAMCHHKLPTTTVTLLTLSNVWHFILSLVAKMHAACSHLPYNGLLSPSLCMHEAESHKNSIIMGIRAYIFVSSRDAMRCMQRGILQSWKYPYYVNDRFFCSHVPTTPSKSHPHQLSLHVMKVKGSRKIQTAID